MGSASASSSLTLLGPENTRPLVQPAGGRGWNLPPPRALNPLESSQGLSSKSRMGAPSPGRLHPTCFRVLQCKRH